MSAATRASTALRATTSLDPESVLAVVKKATGEVKGGGASLLTTGVQNLGARVHVEAEGPGELRLSLNSGKRIVELCTFSATAVAKGGVTSLTVGGLSTYKTTQSRTLGFIPTGPKMIAGMAPYKKYLEAVRLGLIAADTGADVSIAANG